MRQSKKFLGRTAAAGILLPLGLLTISGCSSEEDELPSLVETTEAAEPAEENSGSADSFGDYTGVYDREFYDDVEFYVGEEVTVAAIVDEVVSPNLFTITDTTEPNSGGAPVDIDEVVIEPLLIVHGQAVPGLSPANPVGVVGVVREAFYLATVEEELGVDLDDEAFEQWEEQPYIEVVRAASLIDAG